MPSQIRRITSICASVYLAALGPNDFLKSLKESAVLLLSVLDCGEIIQNLLATGVYEQISAPVNKNVATFWLRLYCLVPVKNE